MCNKLIDTYRLNNQVAKWKVALPGGKELCVNIEITISRGTFVFISACIYWIKEFPFLERQVLFLLFVAFPIKLWGTGHGPRCLRHVNRAGARERLPKFPIGLLEARSEERVLVSAHQNNSYTCNTTLASACWTHLCNTQNLARAQQHWTRLCQGPTRYKRYRYINGG